MTSKVIKGQRKKFRIASEIFFNANNLNFEPLQNILRQFYQKVQITLGEKLPNV